MPESPGKTLFDDRPRAVRARPLKLRSSPARDARNQALVSARLGSARYLTERQIREIRKEVLEHEF